MKTQRIFKYSCDFLYPAPWHKEADKTIAIPLKWGKQDTRTQKNRILLLLFAHTFNELTNIVQFTAVGNIIFLNTRTSDKILKKSNTGHACNC